ncbi:uncharacterized protein K452DRAFT_285889 [Aplosporella prunicola CBS 121167]|uniref:ADP-ribose 1''-phosphate phosphatase n=1 Tax=Aplosporella prunicola CBS 121167 TaxID=1176127 RepID=A0A6A6BMQ8_9PEZI|nr:uncharacterized protein K452DRAFT_285889 [Aplosporella prunicola CBS 121167]KAF2143851.1 hypothetical protein K452DRAFT_285889 [Aplosporella prunicola CBS 121167]
MPVGGKLKTSSEQVNSYGNERNDPIILQRVNKVTQRYLKKPQVNQKTDAPASPAPEPTNEQQQQRTDEKTTDDQASTKPDTNKQNTSPPPPPPPPSTTPRLLIKETVGDIFDAPDNAVLIHACNCIGSWGAGIALAFKQKYPKAFSFYRGFCAQGRAKPGTALLISPRDGQRDHYIGCLFTSVGHGKRADAPAVILRQTKPAMEDLLRRIARNRRESGFPAEVRMCRINSGLFNVPWEDSKGVLAGIEVEPDMLTGVVVYEKAE